MLLNYLDDYHCTLIFFKIVLNFSYMLIMQFSSHHAYYESLGTFSIFGNLFEPLFNLFDLFEADSKFFKYPLFRSAFKLWVENYISNLLRWKCWKRFARLLNNIRLCCRWLKCDTFDWINFLISWLVMLSSSSLVLSSA